MGIVFTNGVFDLFHHGHFELLRRAKAQGEYLLVGVASDESCASLKRTPWQPWPVRARVVAEVPFVDEVIKTPWGIDLTREFYDRHGITVHVQGDKESSFPVAEELGILKVLGRTPGVSTTKLINILQSLDHEILEGGHLNDVRRVYADGPYYVLKYGNRTVARKFQISLPDTRTRDEYEVITAFRQRLCQPDFIVKPIALVDGPIAVLESAPLTAETLVQRLLRGPPEEALLTDIIRNLARMHNATLDDDELRARFAHNPGFMQVKIGVQCLSATSNQTWLTYIDKFIASSLQIKRVLLHGDFAPKNIMVWDSGYLFIDFEESGYGDPALDVGYFLAHLYLHKIISGSDRWQQTIDKVLATYVTAFNAADPELALRVNRYIGIFLLSRLDSPAPADYIPDEYGGAIRALAERLIPGV